MSLLDLGQGSTARSRRLRRRRWGPAEITRLLWEVDRRILQQEPLQKVLGFLVKELGRIFDCQFVWVGLKESEGRVRRGARLGLEDLEEAIVLRWDVDEPDPRPSVHSLRTGEVVTGRFEEAGGGRWRELALQKGLHSYASFPLIAGDGPIGFLALASEQPLPPAEEAVIALRSIADQVAISVVSARAQEQIRLQQVALESSPNGIAIMDASGRVSWVNDAFVRITGVDRAEAVGAALREILHPDQGEAFWESLVATLVRGLPWRGERTNRRKDGTSFTVEKSITAVRDQSGQLSYYVCTLQDVTDRRATEARIDYLTLYDPLTGLPNRRTLEESMAAATQPRALLLAGVDRLKLVNDILGKEAGGQVLIAVAKILRGALGPEHLVTRLDDDLFAILARADGPDEARRVAEQARAAVEAAALQPVDGGLAVTISIGVTPLGGEQPLVEAAKAMAEAKRLGRNRVVLAEELAEEQKPTHVAALIQEAINGTGFLLHLQPIERLATQEQPFYEVLLRIQEPNGGLLLPGQFLEIAAQYHLLPHLDRLVVSQALRLLVDRPELRLFVNLSGQGLSSLSLLDAIEEMVQACGPAVAARLVFEITETTAVRDLGRARQWMMRLSGRGVRFALDDFGSGFASFEYLAALPVEFIKLSGVFVRNIDTSPQHRVMVEAITAVSHALGKQVIAEWVESRQVATMLAGMGVEFGQGFALGRPAPVEE